MSEIIYQSNYSGAQIDQAIGKVPTIEAKLEQKADKAELDDKSDVGHTHDAYVNKNDKTDYIATSVIATMSNWHYEFTIDDFVYKNGCKITGILPTKCTTSDDSMYVRIKKGTTYSEWFRIADMKNRVVNLSGSWEANTTVTFVLSDTILAQYKTAFLQTKADIVVKETVPSTTNVLWAW